MGNKFDSILFEFKSNDTTISFVFLNVEDNERCMILPELKDGTESIT